MKTGPVVGFAFANADPQSVTLTVTDNAGSTSTFVVNPVLTAYPADQVARDTFTRTGSDLDDADLGGTYLYPFGPATSFAATGTAATVTIPTAGNAREALLPETSMPRRSGRESTFVSTPPDRASATPRT